jgi:hypothetical protein
MRSPGDGRVEVFGEAAVTIEPGKGAFDDPAERENLKTDGVGHAAHDLDRQAAEFGQCVAELVAGVGAVGKQLAEPRKEIVNGGDDERSPVAVLQVCGMNFDAEQQVSGVGDQMTFVAFDLLCRTEAARATGLSGPDRLTVDNARRRAGLSTRRVAGLQQQFEIDPLQHAGAAPSIEIMLHRRIGRKLTRQLPPLAAGPHHIEQHIDHGAHFRLWWPSQAAAPRQSRLDDRPVGVVEVA